MLAQWTVGALALFQAQSASTVAISSFVSFECLFPHGFEPAYKVGGPAVVGVGVGGTRVLYGISLGDACVLAPGVPGGD